MGYEMIDQTRIRRIFQSGHSANQWPGGEMAVFVCVHFCLVLSLPVLSLPSPILTN